MSSLHTPGPLHQDEHNPLVIVNSDGSSLGEASAGDPFIGHEEQLANARLWAAAPDLLAIAQMVANLGEYRALVEEMAQVLRPHERESFIKLYRETARAVIAKAVQS